MQKYLSSTTLIGTTIVLCCNGMTHDILEQSITLYHYKSLGGQDAVGGHP